MLKSLTRFIKYGIVFENTIQYQKSVAYFSPVVYSHQFRNQFHLKLSNWNADSETGDISETNDNLCQILSVLTAIRSDVVTEVKSMKHIDEILKFLRNNSDVEAVYYEPILSTIVKLQRERKTSLSNYQLQRTQEIELFLQKVNKDVGLLDLNDLLNILNMFCFLKIEPSSELIQHILPKLTGNINQINLEQLVFLSNLIKQYKSNRQVDVLKMALNFILHKWVLSHTEHANPADIAKIFDQIFKNDLFNKKTVGFLINSAYKIKDRFDCKASFTVLMCLSKIKRNLPKKMILYHDLMKKVTLNMHDSLEFSELIRLVTVSVDNFIFHHVSYYNHEFMSEAVDYVITNKGTLYMAGDLLKILNRISYQSLEKLLLYMDERIFYSKNEFDIYGISPFIHFITACANISYKPKYWDMYQDDLISFIDKKKNSELPILGLTINFITMNCWVSSLIEYCFSEEFLYKQFCKEERTVVYVKLLNLYHFVQTLCPGGYKKSLPPIHILEKTTKLHFSLPENSVDALAHGLGGYKYVLNGVRTRFGYRLDHLIVKDKYGNTVVINENENKGISETTVESLNIPVNCSPIAILYLTPNLYLLDGIQMRGETKLIIKSIEACGILVIPIARIKIDELSNHDKISYFLKEIDSKMKTTDFSKYKGIKTLCSRESNLPH